MFFSPVAFSKESAIVNNVWCMNFFMSSVVNSLFHKSMRIAVLAFLSQNDRIIASADAPSTPPSLADQFIGWQMVRTYMDANPEITVEELLNEESETKILKAYKPKENE